MHSSSHFLFADKLRLQAVSPSRNLSFFYLFFFLIPTFFINFAAVLKMVLSKSSSDALLSKIRDGLAMTGSEKLNLIVALSMPSILAQITSVLMFYIDASMVGSLGAEASASIGIVEPATWLFGSLVSACSMGFYVQAAHFIGAKDFAQARRVMQHGYIFGLAVALILMTVGIVIASPLPRLLGGGADIQGDATTYFLILSMAAPIHLIENLSSQMLKVSGDMRHPSVIAVAMCFADVFFNFLFIFPTREITLFALHIKVFGFGLGVAGAAIGTLLAYLFACVPLVYYAVFKSKILAWRLSKGPFRWNAEYITSAVKLGAPMALQYLLMNGAQIVSTMIVAPLGNFAIAANSFAVTAESLCYMPGYGIGDAATTLVGQSVGARRKDICKSFAHMTVILGMIVMAFMGLLMYIFAPEMIGILSPVPEIRALGTQVLRIEAFAEPFFAASIVAYSVCIGAGDTAVPSFINLGSMWFVRLTLAAALAPVYGLPGVWFAMATELTVRGILFLIRLLRGKWMRKIEDPIRTAE